MNSNYSIFNVFSLTTIILETEEFVRTADRFVSKINLYSSQNPMQFCVITTFIERVKIKVIPVTGRGNP
jgi:hypothetical protein